MTVKRKRKGGQTKLYTIFFLGCSIYSFLSLVANYRTLEQISFEHHVMHQRDKQGLSTGSEQLMQNMSQEALQLLYTQNEAIEKEVRNKISDSSRPDIAWLMSFPNSGTSYTMRMVTEDSNHTVATNYPNEPEHCGREILPLYRTSKVPLFLLPNMSMPSKYILTKTHCGGHCLHCEPEIYARLNVDDFLSKCSSSKSEEFGYYNNSANLRVKKAVHLIRDPFDNAVSNFHHLLKQFERKNQTGLLQLFPNSREGFRSFCDVSLHYPNSMRLC